MSYNSKYTGEEVENILDKVNSGHIDTLKWTLGVVELKSMIGTKISIPLDATFIEYLKAGNKILIPYELGNPEKGYYILTGHITTSNMLSFTLPINNGEIIYCNNVKIASTAPTIHGTDLSLVNVISLSNDKQDALESGKNISTINEHNILLGGDIQIGPKVVSLVPNGMLNKQILFTLGWDKIQVVTLPVLNLSITKPYSDPTSFYSESTVIFSLSSLAGTVSICPGMDIKWANGIDPTKSLQVNVVYELSISAVKINNTYKYNGILVPFNDN